MNYLIDFGPLRRKEVFKRRSQIESLIDLTVIEHELTEGENSLLLAVKCEKDKLKEILSVLRPVKVHNVRSWEVVFHDVDIDEL